MLQCVTLLELLPQTQIVIIPTLKSQHHHVVHLRPVLLELLLRLVVLPPTQIAQLQLFNVTLTEVLGLHTPVHRGVVEIWRLRLVLLVEHPVTEISIVYMMNHQLLVHLVSSRFVLSVHLPQTFAQVFLIRSLLRTLLTLKPR